MNKKSYIIKIVTVLLVLVCFIGTVALADSPPDGYATWDDYYNFLIYGTQAGDAEADKDSEMKTVAENDNFKMLFDEQGLDFYVEDKNSDKVWSSAVSSDYMDTSKMSAESISSLVDVILSTGDGEITTKILTDSNNMDFSVTTDSIDNGLVFHISLPEAKVSFDLNLSLNGDSIDVLIPEKSIVEDGDLFLLSVDVLPSFGITAVGEDGYVFYPDGSGALMNIREYASDITESYSWSFYGQNNPDMNKYNENKEQNIKNLQLPVYGLNQKSGGFLAAITDGDTDAHLNIEVSNYYRTWFRFDYRMHTSAEFNYTGGSFGGGSISKLLPNRIKGDRGIKYFLLRGKNNTYSDMAVVYRNYLIQEGILKELSAKEEIPVFFDVLMSATENGMFGRNIIEMTSYEDADNMATKLQKSNVNINMRLLGWSKGGYEAVPSVFAAESSLGSKKDIKNLSKTLKSKNGRLFFGVDLLTADIEQGSFNKKTDVLRDLLGAPITDYDEKMFFINPVETMDKETKSGIDYIGEMGTVSLDKVGEILFSNLYENDAVDRKTIAETYRKSLAAFVKKQNGVAVSGGNYYVLNYADTIFELPDTDSAYYQNDVVVPFYQIVTHGSVNYTSQTGNLSGDLQLQKLRWIETGSIPSFFITEKSPILLKNTGCAGIFSSEFSKWEDSVVEISNEFNQRLKNVWYEKIKSHKVLKKDVVCITYENDAKIYINYSDKTVTVAGEKIPAKEYLVIGG